MDLSKIPNRLRGKPYFCLMKLEQKLGKTKKDKVPYRTNGARADPSNPEHFTSLEKVMKVFDKGGYDGIGIGLFDDNIAIDIDDCVENGKLSAMAAEIVDSLGSYAELSISGTGVHIWARAPGLIYDNERYYFNNRTYGLEIYPAGVTTKFIVTTGNARKVTLATEGFLLMCLRTLQDMCRNARSGLSTMAPAGLQISVRLRLWNLPKIWLMHCSFIP